MKTKYIILTAAFLFSVNAPTQAQSDEGGFLEGIQSSLSNMFDSTIQGTEAGRLYMLFNSDIRMIMKVHNDKEVTTLYDHSSGYYSIGFIDSSSDASMYAEFDWDNKALSMHLKESENYESIAWFAPIVANGEQRRTNKANDHYQFTDKHGYWYVPADSSLFGGEAYIKFNAKGTAQAVLGLSELNTQIIAEEMLLVLNALDRIMNRRTLNGGSEPFFVNLFGIFGSNFNTENQERRRTEIRNLLNERYTSIEGFPVFIHWALLYSPDVIRANYNVTETTGNYYNNTPDSWTKLTVTSGKERGKYMIFDQYNRLIYIDSKKDGSVQFNYDWDLTVRLPPAMKISDVMGILGRRN